MNKAKNQALEGREELNHGDFYKSNVAFMLNIVGIIRKL